MMHECVLMRCQDCGELYCPMCEAPDMPEVFVEPDICPVCLHHNYLNQLQRMSAMTAEIRQLREDVREPTNYTGEEDDL